jgi:hypothetical protein
MQRVVGIIIHCCIVTASQSRSRNSPTSSQTHRQQIQESLSDNVGCKMISKRPTMVLYTHRASAHVVDPGVIRI